MDFRLLQKNDVLLSAVMQVYEAYNYSTSLSQKSGCF